MNPHEALKKLHALDGERMHLSRAAAVLRWDQETCLPPGGVEDRAEQLAVLEGLAHERLVNPEIGRLLKEFPDFSGFPPEGDLPAPEQDFIRVLRRDYDRAAALPADFVREAARAEGLSQAAWVEARKNSDFAAFAPHLQKMLDFARKKAAYWGFGGTAKGESLYDGLLDLHEPGMNQADLAALFAPLGEKLSGLLKKIAPLPPPEDHFLHERYDPAAQADFNRRLMAGLGFDMRRGRLDVSAHPFTTTLGFNDVRITTRYFPDNPLSGIFSVIHESGHAFYEMGIDPALRSGCLAEGVSMGIHESQSRLWENVIGRSRAFWEGWFPLLRAQFPAQLGAVDGEAFYRALNRAGPSPIRVDADELSYSLHIILRFELEKRLFSGELDVDGLPAAWNRAVKDYLGIESENDAAGGVLQDVHWSMGAFGYFPSYALGNLYSLLFWKKLKEDLPGIESALERREYGGIHGWLGEKIHRWGRRLNPGELLMNITGETLSAGPFLEYVEGKYRELYGI